MRHFAILIALLVTSVAMAVQVTAQNQVRGTLQIRSSDSSGLIVGDKVPALRVSQWLAGDKVDGFENGKTFVVVFWSTWSTPYNVLSEDLVEVAEEFEEKVSVVAINIWESPEIKPDQIRNFIKENGKIKGVSVGMDEEDHMAEDWMIAARRGTLPTAFIVNKDKKIAWIGPTDGLVEPMEQVVAGKWDIEKARNEDLKSRNLNRSLQELANILDTQLILEDFLGAVKTVDAIIKLTPYDKSDLHVMKCELMMGYDEKAAQEHMLKLSQSVLKEDADQLNRLAWLIVDPDQEWKKPNIQVALKIAKRACDLTEYNNAFILDTYALALYHDKKFKDAIKYQTKAVELAKKDPKISTDLVVTLQERLQMFLDADED